MYHMQYDSGEHHISFGGYWPCQRLREYACCRNEGARTCPGRAALGSVSRNCRQRRAVRGIWGGGLSLPLHSSSVRPYAHLSAILSMRNKQQGSIPGTIGFSVLAGAAFGAALILFFFLPGLHRQSALLACLLWYSAMLKPLRAHFLALVCCNTCCGIEIAWTFGGSSQSLSCMAVDTMGRPGKPVEHIEPSACQASTREVLPPTARRCCKACCRAAYSY